jgi:hypothetical protein
MTTLAKDTPRAYLLADYDDQPIIAADIIYEGAAVGDNGSGYARPLVAGDPFLGFATQQCDNTQTGNAAGSKRVRVKRKGAIQLSISGLAITDVGKAVYASDDDTFTLTASTNTCIGSVRAWVSTGIGIIEFEATESRITKLTAASGTAGDTIVDGGATYDQGKVNDNFASLAAKVNYLMGRGD